MTTPGQILRVRYDPEGAFRRVTILQLLQATQNDTSQENQFLIDGIGFKTIVVVANVYLNESEGSVGRYGLDDGTGRIRARYQAPIDSELPRFPDFGYVRVVGELSQYRSGLKSIKALAVVPVICPHEIYFHTLQSIVDTLTYERSPPEFGATLRDQEPPEEFIHNQTYSFASTGSNVQPYQLSQSKNINLQASPSKQQAIGSNTSKYPTKYHVGDALSSIGSRSRSHNYDTSSGDTITQDITSSSVKTFPRRKKSELVQPNTSTATAMSSSSYSYAPMPPTSVEPSKLERMPISDPLSGLSEVQREIILCIKHVKEREYTAAQNDTGNTARNVWERDWNGVSIEVIVKSVRHRRPNVTHEEFHNALAKLLEEAHIYNPMELYFDTIS
ncbi:hypothetical protein BDQ17DRAFT_1404321 [Cyathus striatus]|nr:hypothetical protein BDQ17DRAFT_1404321 [Cyathus striatus]